MPFCIHRKTMDIGKKEWVHEIGVFGNDEMLGRITHANNCVQILAKGRSFVRKYQAGGVTETDRPRFIITFIFVPNRSPSHEQVGLEGHFPSGANQKQKGFNPNLGGRVVIDFNRFDKAAFDLVFVCEINGFLTHGKILNLPKGVNKQKCHFPWRKSRRPKAILQGLKNWAK
jgi:hypothetical protein